MILNWSGRQMQLHLTIINLRSLTHKWMMFTNAKASEMWTDQISRCAKVTCGYNSRLSTCVSFSRQFELKYQCLENISNVDRRESDIVKDGARETLLCTLHSFDFFCCYFLFLVADKNVSKTLKTVGCQTVLFFCVSGADILDFLVMRLYIYIRRNININFEHNCCISTQDCLGLSIHSTKFFLLIHSNELSEH